MAAKPPKPPGKFLKSLLSQNSKLQAKQQQQHINNEQQQEQETQQCNSEICHTSTTTDNCNTTTAAAAATTTTTTAKKSDCNCSNISIMHLFHEMKQEFPTIPDTVVAQCVNENCHQRENCIQMLRNELALNPIPAQSYPTKILHPPTTTNNNRLAAAAAAGATTAVALTPTSSQKPPLQQKPQLGQQKPPLKPLRPIRTAPLHPSTPTTQNTPQLQKPPNSPGNVTTATTTTTTNRNKLLSGGVGVGRGECNGSVCGGDSGVGVGELNNMPSVTSPQHKQTQQPQPLTVNSTNEVNNNENAVVCSVGVGENNAKNIPKQRPTTLNLNAHHQNQQQQQQQRQRLNIQLQKHFQEQRNKQHQHQQQQPPLPQTTKPTRKAPLPPIAPKPSQYQFNSTPSSNNNNNNNNNNNTHFNDTLSSTHTSPLSESEISVSVSLSTPSPTSSLPKTTNQHSTPIQPPNQQLQTKSPIRHRSVITLQPEPPYTRDFASATSNALVISSSANTSPTTSLAGSQKSFTSVNLTLRPPVLTPTGSGGTPGTALQLPSTIDITAGPGFSGASGGGKSLHYSSTSYDARLGYQQNFQITVTDEGGVFSASRIRPQQQQQQRCLNQQQSLQQQQQLYKLQHQQFHNNNVVALQQNIQNSINSPQAIGGGGGVSGAGDKMCVPPQQALDGFTAEILQRQKKRRDKLAAALRENKKRLGQVEHEINLIAGPIPPGLSERLDIEIQKLRTDCQAMLRSSNPFTQQTTQEQQLENNDIQPQPFPRQRPGRPPPRPPPPRQGSLDFIQHHSQPTTPYTTPTPAASLPNINVYNTPSPTLGHHHPPQLDVPHSNSLLPPFYSQYQQLTSSLPPPADIITEDIYSDDDEEEYVDDGHDDEYEPWECNMCTFCNHPQLNICEACDNVRILPGTLPNLSRAISNNSANSANSAAAAVSAVSSPTTIGLLSVPSPVNGAATDNNAANIVANGLNTTAVANGNLEHDTNLPQQQLQHFALHT